MRIYKTIAITLLLHFGYASAAAKTIHHYVFFGQDREQMQTSQSFLETREFEGAQVSYSWRQLEPQKDQYDFGIIREDLAFLNSKGKKLWIQIQDVTFTAQRINVPKYLLNDPEYHGGAAKQYRIGNDDETKAVHEGWMARRWDPAVQERFHKLLAALGKEFDGRITGINLDETSSGFGQSGKLFPAGYTLDAYRDAIITNFKALKRAFPKSIAMQYANFMPGGRKDLELVYRAAREARVAVGGPDLLPFRPFQMANSYPLIRAAENEIVTGIAVQDGNYADINPKTGKRAGIAELLKFARDYLKVDYIFWCTEEPYYSNDLVPFMRASGKNSR